MTQHASLRAAARSKKYRSVLKRYERLKKLEEKEKWDEDKDSVYGLPKLKIIKFKVKKEKAPEEEKTAEGLKAEPSAGADHEKKPTQSAKKEATSQKEKK